MTQRFSDAARGWAFADVDGLAKRIRICEAIRSSDADDDRVLVLMRQRLERLLNCRR